MITRLGNYPLIAVSLILLCVIRQSVGRVTYEQDTKLSKTQKQALEKFKTRVLPKLEYAYQKEQSFLVKHLRLKNFDVAKAEEFILTQMKWRKDENMENIHKENWKDMEREYPMRVEGFDREGRPLIVWELGDWDLKKAAIAGKTDRLIRWTNKNWDAARLKVRELEMQGKNVSRWTMVLDLKNINSVTNVNTASFPWYIAAAVGYDTHFPNNSDQIFLLNTPGIFETVLALVKPILDKGTRDSLIVYPKNEKQWGPIVKAAIDPSQLPKRYGGRKEDPH